MGAMFKTTSGVPAGDPKSLRTRLLTAARMSYDEAIDWSDAEVARQAEARGVEVTDEMWRALGVLDGTPKGWRIARQKAVDPFRSWGL